MLQPATAKKKSAKAAPAATPAIDLTFGFPGQIPRARQRNQQEQFLRFFVEYTKDQNARAAARRAGYSEKWGKQYSYRFLKEHADYVKWLQAHAAQQAVKQLVIDQDSVLQEIARLGFANEFDYLVFEEKGDKVQVRRKRLDELSREQMAAIRVYGKDGALQYELRDKEGKLTELARHVGLLNEKIILERRNFNLSVKLKMDFSQASIEDLEAIEARYEQIFQNAGKGRLLEQKA